MWRSQNRSSLRQIEDFVRSSWLQLAYLSDVEQFYFIYLFIFFFLAAPVHCGRCYRYCRHHCLLFFGASSSFCSFLCFHFYLILFSSPSRLFLRLLWLFVQSFRCFGLCVWLPLVFLPPPSPFTSPPPQSLLTTSPLFPPPRTRCKGRN